MFKKSIINIEDQGKIYVLVGLKPNALISPMAHQLKTNTTNTCKLKSHLIPIN